MGVWDEAASKYFISHFMELWGLFLLYPAFPGSSQPLLVPGAAHSLGPPRGDLLCRFPQEKWSLGHVTKTKTEKMVMVIWDFPLVVGIQRPWSILVARGDMGLWWLWNARLDLVIIEGFPNLNNWKGKAFYLSTQTHLDVLLQFLTGILVPWVLILCTLNPPGGVHVTAPNMNVLGCF